MPNASQTSNCKQLTIDFLKCFRFKVSGLKLNPGFTLIELLVVIAILGILSGIVMFAINPTKRIKQARDARRKAEIKQISNAIQAYLLKFNFSEENWCDSSMGSHDQPCNTVTLEDNDWKKDPPDNYLYQAIVVDSKYLKSLPVDPVNKDGYFYELEVYQYNIAANTPCDSTQGGCKYYWLGTRLEAPEDPTKAIFRCSNNTALPNGPGCKEIAQGLSPGLGNDDPDCTEADGDCW